MKAAVLDFDGTLVDTMEFWNDLAKNYLKSIGIEALDDLNEALEKLTVDEGISYMKEKYKIEKTSREIQDEMDKLLLKYYREDVQLKPYVIEMLEKLDEKNIRMAIASVIDEKLILSVLNKYNISHYFEFIQTCENTGLSKDDIRFFDLLPKRLNLKSDEIYMFEDSLYPIVAAKDAGLKLVGVKDSAAAKYVNEIEKIVDIYIEDFSEILAMLEVI